MMMVLTRIDNGNVGVEMKLTTIEAEVKRKAGGPESLHPRTLKELDHDIANPVVSIFLDSHVKDCTVRLENSKCSTVLRRNCEVKFHGLIKLL